MFQFPVYRIRNDVFTDLAGELKIAGLELVCVDPQHLQRDGVTLYRGWEVKSSTHAKVKVIMWDKYKKCDAGCTITEVTFGTPNGKNGDHLLLIVENSLIKLGGLKID
jgi:hypothetical protein